MFLSVDSLIQLNNLILGVDNKELRKVNVKPAGYPIYLNPYFPWYCVENSLYILTDNFNNQHISNKEFCETFMEIHPFLDGNDRTCKLLFVDQIIESCQKKNVNHFVLLIRKKIIVCKVEYFSCIQILVSSISRHSDDDMQVENCKKNLMDIAI